MDLQEEKQMNNFLRDNQEEWQKRVETLEGQIKNITEIKDKVISLCLYIRNTWFYKNNDIFVIVKT